MNIGIIFINFELNIYIYVIKIIINQIYNFENNNIRREENENNKIINKKLR